MTNAHKAGISIGDRIGQLAAEHPDTAAVTSVRPDGARTTMTWGELEERINRAANCLATTVGIVPGSTVGIALPTGLDHVIATLAAWKLHTLVVPLDANATEAERAAQRDALGDHVLIGTGEWATITPQTWRNTTCSPEVVLAAGLPRSAALTGGTTGKPRVVLRPRPWCYPHVPVLSAWDAARGVRNGGVQLVTLPMYHAGFTALYHSLALDQHVVIMERFVPSLFPRLVSEFSVDQLRIVPTLMKMILGLSNLKASDLATIRSLSHGTGPCPAPVKRAWLDLIGPEHVYEDYVSQERIGWTVIRGDDWLTHPGSVGKPTEYELRIYHDDHEAAPGEVGEVYFRAPSTRQPSYLGHGPELEERDGFLSVGDLGYLDHDGYLYLVDRKTNVINVGGINVYPAEIEAALAQHPAVADVAVVGRPHRYLGQATHALVLPAGKLAIRELQDHCRSLLSAAKAPMSFELVDNLPRRDTGKLPRSHLR